MTDLSALEVQELADCEQVVDRGFSTFVEVGIALRTIKKKKLYRQKAKTFEAYAVKRFSASRYNLFSIVEAAETAKFLGMDGDLSEDMKDAMAPLAGLSAGTQRVVWAQASEEGKPTEDSVEAVLARVAAALDDLPQSDQEVLLDRQDQQSRADESDRLSLTKRDKALRQGLNYAERSRKAAVFLKNFPEVGNVKRLISLSQKLKAEWESLQPAQVIA